MGTVLVTGGCGFIGRAIVQSALRADPDAEVVVYDLAPLPAAIEYPAVSQVVGSVLDWPLLLRTMSSLRPDAVYHCSGVLGTSELIEAIQTALAVNVNGVVNVLEACRYVAEQNDSPIKVFFPAKPNDWRNVYSITKYAAEQFVHMAGELYPGLIKPTVMRWFNAYGPYQHYWPVRKAVPTFFFQAIEGWPITIFDDGLQLVDMVYVQDVADVAVAAVEGGWCETGGTYDVGCGESITVNELAGRVLKTVEDTIGAVYSSIVHLPMRPGEPRGSMIRSDPRLLRENAVKLTPMDEGLMNTCVWALSIPKAERLRVLRDFSRADSDV